MVTGCRSQPLNHTRIKYRRSLTDVFVGQLMRQTDTLGLMLDRFAVHDSMLELIYNGFMDGMTLVPGQFELW